MIFDPRGIKVYLILMPIFLGIDSHKFKIRNNARMAEAVQFMTKVDREINRLTQIAAHAEWSWSVNVTSHNRQKMDKANLVLDSFTELSFRKIHAFPWRTFKHRNETLYRWFQIAAIEQSGSGKISVGQDNSTTSSEEEEENEFAQMEEIFSQVQLCPFKKRVKACTISYEPDVMNIMANSRNPEELKHYWNEFRRKTGRKYKELFIQSVDQDNEWAKRIGYTNKGEYNIAMYEDKNLVENLEKEMKKFQPFYQQIHAYVRKKLIHYYPNVTILPDGPIPAHLLGNMYAQSWVDIYPMVVPYPKHKAIPDVTDEMIKKKMRPLDLLVMAEKFFTSIGLKKMTPHFWRYSMLQKPKNKNVSCHASALDFYNGKDFRILMCGEVDAGTLETVHHEMGHIQYYMHYSHLPQLFRESANPGFHEAIGDAISLSVSTPEYLRTVSLFNEKNINTDRKSNINYLMYMALQYAVGLPFSYIIDHWRNKVYSGVIKARELNRKYWDYRLKYQGVCPPVKRNERDFDIGAKYHIAVNMEYNRYFVANILQFQIHKILCKEAGHTGSLHQCNIYSNKNAGSALARLLKYGRSKPWQEVMRIFSGNTTEKLDSSALLEYFEPLMNWFKRVNQDEYIGWKSTDSMSCPG